MPRYKPKNHHQWWTRINWKTIGIVMSVITIIIVPITILSINWANVRILYATGSSAVYPLMKELSRTYQENNNNKPSIDISIEATGSGSGIEKILSNNTNFGNISFSPSLEYIKKNGYEQKWNSLDIKTISWGIDGISLVYYGNFNLDINNNNIKNLIIAFSGLESLTYADLGANSNIKVTPYARTGGANKSGTTEAFIKNSHFDLNHQDKLLNSALEKIETGQYGQSVITTKESQAETWHQMSVNPFAGQIAYLSTGFVLENKKEINAAGYKIATYNGNELNKQNLQSGKYNWRRILNSLVSIKKLDKNLQTWVNWILLEHYFDHSVKETFDRIGIVQLNQQQIAQMIGKNNNFWTSDFDLGNPNQVNNNFVYGVRI